jgi:transcriptional antiterminator NusG
METNENKEMKKEIESLESVEETVGEIPEPGGAESEAAEKKPSAKKTQAAKSGKKSGAKAASTKLSAEPSGATAEADAEEKPEGPPKKWYVIHTYSGHENKVKENITKMVVQSSIQDHFGQLVVPTEEVAEMKKGKKTVTTKKFFPSYILIEMYMSDDAWHLVNAIPGVTSFVGAGDKPQPLSKPEVERILGRMDKEKQTIIPEIPFTLGEHIRIKDGPFSDFTGVIDEINAEKGKLKVLVSIFGRETPVELDFLQVESLS